MSIIAAFYPQSSTYQHDFSPAQLALEKLSHIIYGHLLVTPEGAVEHEDIWVDVQKHFDEHWSKHSAEKLFGALGQLWRLKQLHPTLKVSVSLSFAAPAQLPSSELHSLLVRNILGKIEDLALDGIDLDLSNVTSKSQGATFLQLAMLLAYELKVYAQKKQHSPYLLSCTVPAEEEKYLLLPLTKLASYVDLFYLKAFDFTPTNTKTFGYYSHARLFGPNPSVAYSVQDYLNAGIPPSKLVLGIPTFGKCFYNNHSASVHSPLNINFKPPNKKKKKLGIYHYKDLAQSKAGIVYFDQQACSASCYDKSSKEWIFYDDVRVVERKSLWASKEMCLAGVCFWNLAADSPDPQLSLLSKAHASLDPLCHSRNHLEYPDSRYVNVRYRDLSSF